MEKEKEIPKRSSSPYLSLTYYCSIFLVFSICIYATITNYIYPLPTTPTINQFVSVNSLNLNDSQISSIKNLGLTPKKPVQIINNDGKKMTIHGRFLHITDLHIDPYYKDGSDFDEMCHRGKSGEAGKYGDAIMGCDSPPLLVDETFKWIRENLIDKIDFIIYTGDSPRHDNDREYPRTQLKITEMNKDISRRFEELAQYNKDGELNPWTCHVSGNNCVWPHQTIAMASDTIRELFSAWKEFIPSYQMHTYLQGAYFFQEIIPNQLAVLSLNSLFWFSNNPLVDDCDTPSDAGYKHFEWLGYVLKEMRARNMKVWLSSHVPPNEKNFDNTCLRKYIVWTHEYRDVIIGGLYGHMNLDHFIPLDSVQAYKSIKKDFKNQFTDSAFSAFEIEEEELGESGLYKALDENFSDGFFKALGGVPSNKVKYMDTLRENLYAPLKGQKKSGEYYERYSVAHVGASVIPTFNPGLRVWEYNITNLEQELQQVKFEPWDKFFAGVEKMVEVQSKYESDDEASISKKKHKKNKKKKNKKKKRDHTFPKPMPKDRPLGPAYIEQTYTPERYVQYYADLDSINKGKKDFGYEIEYSTDDSLYGMASLTVKNWIEYGRKLGKPIKEANADGKKKNKKGKKKKTHGKLDKIWTNYLKNTFVSSDYEHKGYG